MRLIIAVLLLSLIGCGDRKKTELNASLEYSRETGGLRTERNPADAPIDAALLAANFRKIAYDVEDDPFGIGEEQSSESRRPHLIRWSEKITLEVFTGPDVPRSAEIDAQIFLEKLSAITGVPVAIADDFLLEPEPEGRTNLLMFMGDGAFFDLVLEETIHQGKQSEGNLAASAAYFQSFVENWHASASPCGGTLFTEPGDDGEETGRIRAAIVMIRTDLIAPITQSCIEEEMAQIMGLLNDDPTVRPSIFNDDAEFALMTLHDELLLRILYDDRLRPGMSPEQSMPTVRRIARELLPES